MLYLDGFFGLIFLAVWIFCLIDVITTPADSVRNLPKIAWVIIVLVLDILGAVIWLVAGRPQAGATGNRLVPPTDGFPEYERLGRATGTSATSDDEFLRECRARAEVQREKYRREHGAA